MIHFIIAHGNWIGVIISALIMFLALSPWPLGPIGGGKK